MTLSYVSNNKSLTLLNHWCWCLHYVVILWFEVIFNYIFCFWTKNTYEGNTVEAAFNPNWPSSSVSSLLLLFSRCKPRRGIVVIASISLNPIITTFRLRVIITSSVVSTNSVVHSCACWAFPVTFYTISMIFFLSNSKPSPLSVQKKDQGTFSPQYSVKFLQNGSLSP